MRIHSTSLVLSIRISNVLFCLYFRTLRIYISPSPSSFSIRACCSSRLNESFILSSVCLFIFPFSIHRNISSLNVLHSFRSSLDMIFQYFSSSSLCSQIVHHILLLCNLNFFTFSTRSRFPFLFLLLFLFSFLCPLLVFNFSQLSYVWFCTTGITWWCGILRIVQIRNPIPSIYYICNSTFIFITAP